MFSVICIFYYFELFSGSKPYGSIKMSIIGALRKRGFAEEMGKNAPQLCNHCMTQMVGPLLLKKGLLLFKDIIEPADIAE